MAIPAYSFKIIGGTREGRVARQDDNVPQPLEDKLFAPVFHYFKGNPTSKNVTLVGGLSKSVDGGQIQTFQLSTEGTTLKGLMFINSQNMVTGFQFENELEDVLTIGNYIDYSKRNYYKVNVVDHEKGVAYAMGENLSDRPHFNDDAFGGVLKELTTKLKEANRAELGAIYYGFQEEP